MCSKSKKYLPFLIFSAVFFLFAGQRATALSLNPPTFDLAADRGQKIETAVTVFNETEKPLELFSEAVNFSVQNETGQPVFDFEDTAGTAAWFKVSSESITLAAKERKEVPVTINIPADAEPGGHYVTLFFGTQNKEIEKQGDAQISINSKLGSVFLIRVGGEVIEAGALVEFATKNNQLFFNRLPVSFVVLFQNSGNVHLKPVGTISINNLFDREIKTMEVNPQKLTVLPGVSRKYETSWGEIDNSSKRTMFYFWQELAREWKNFSLGKYQATLNISYGSNEANSASGVLSFWIFPWRLFLTALNALAPIILLLVIAVSRYNAWIVKKAQKGYKYWPKKRNKF